MNVSLRMPLLSLLAILFLAAFVAVVPSIRTAFAESGSASDGTRTLTVSDISGLNVDGDTVTVSGSGYDMEKGVYVAFCIVPVPGQRPTPCGNVDISGGSTSAYWISSNAPPYGDGLALPYGSGGTFSVELSLGATFNNPPNGSVDCRVVSCAVVTFSDHTRLSDRSQDVIVPVTFGGEEPTATNTPPTPPTSTQTPVPGASSTPVPQSTQAPATAGPSAAASATVVAVVPTSPSGASPTGVGTSPRPTLSSTQKTAVPQGTPRPGASVVPTATGLPAVTTKISNNGRTATAGELVLTSSKVRLEGVGGEVKIEGKGYNESKGVYVALCAVPEKGKAPKVCAAGDGVSAWISSNPPDYGIDLAEPYEDGGSFGVELALKPVIDTKTDCRVVACAIITRNDDTAAEDRSQDVILPVSFGTNASSGSTPKSGVQGAVASPTDGGGGGGANPIVWVVLSVIALGALGGGAYGIYLYQRGRVQSAGI